MELAGAEGVGSTGASQRGQNFVVAQRELEGFENVGLDAVDQVAQPGQTNEWRQTR